MSTYDLNLKATKDNILMQSDLKEILKPDLEQD
jgi:hypothetical protein